MKDEEKDREQLITELVEVRQKLSELETEAAGEGDEPFRIFFDFAPVGMVICNEEGVVQANSAFQQMFGYTVEELRSMSFKELTHPEDMEKSMGLQRELVEGKRDHLRLEKRYKARDGRVVWADTTVSAVRDEKGKPRYMIAMVEDITERKRALEALRESEERYRTLIDSVTDVIHTKDAEGRYVTVNAELARRWGVSKEDMIGKTALDFYPPELGREILEEELRVVKTGTMIETEREIPTARGPIVSFIRKVPLRNDAGEVVGVVTVSRNITERKRALEALRILFDVASLLVQPGSFEEKVNRVLQSLLPVVQADSATFRLLDSERQRLRLVSTVGHPSSWVEKRPELPLDRGISGMAATTQQPVIANDYAHHPSAVSGSIDAGVQAAAALPMRAGTGVLGVVSVTSRRLGHFTPQRVQLLTAIVNQLGVLFENARAQGALRDMALFAALNPAPVLSFDDRGVVLSSNSAALSMLGQEVRESAPLASLLPSMAGIDLGRCIREGLVITHEAGVGERHFQFVIKGAPDLGIGHVYASDITELQEALEALQESEARMREGEARMRAVVNGVLDGIITIDEHGIVQSFNPASERMFGYRAAEVIGRNVTMLMPEPYRSEHDGYLARYLRTGQAKIIGIGREVVGLHRDGTTFPMDMAVTEALETEGRRFIGVVQDITERKQAEERVQQTIRELTALNDLFQSHLAERYDAERRYHSLANGMMKIAQEIQAIAKETEAWRSQVESLQERPQV